MRVITPNADEMYVLCAISNGAHSEYALIEQTGFERDRLMACLESLKEKGFVNFERIQTDVLATAKGNDNA